MNKLYLYITLVGLVAAGLAGCSGEGHGFVSRAYQNTTAHYNAYFLGNERLRALEADVAAKAVPDYNHILPIFPVIDSTTANGLKKDLEEVVKKASFPIQKHGNSDWTDDSYLIIGKSRFYAREFDDAIKTFKYVNSTGKDEVVRHEALVWLMRSFVNIEDTESAKAVSDIMKKQFLTKENARLLFLTRAQYHLLLKDPKMAIDNLKLAIPLIEKKDEAIRIRFILAQLYQETGQDKLAYKEFNKIIRKNPPYELGFESKLHLGQVTEITDANGKETIDKYFKKLRKDRKNKDYLDKIYYEMARFELKQQKHDQALLYLREAVKASTVNIAQKGYAYLLAGKIYYEKLQNYRLAQAYYDSAVQALPPTVQDYAAAAARRSILDEFVSHYEVVQREDSLQLLASLDKPTLDARLDAIIKRAEEQKAAEAKRAAEAADKAAKAKPLDNNRNAAFGNNTADPFGNTANTTTTASGLWYFDNPATIGSARSEFVRRWGNRQLQDNWRISTQQSSGPQQDLAAISPGPLPGTAPDAAAQADAQRTALLENIPLTPEMRTISNKRIEESLFALASIYREKLKEPAHAAETYEKLLTRFPASSHTAEIYYTLYLLYKATNDPKQATYAARLRQQFPNSRYTKLMDQPDYLAQVSAGNAKVRQLYDQAYVLYEKQKYKEANQLLNNLRQQYPDAEVMDKIAFLNVTIIGQTEQPSLFKLALKQFIKNYPTSSLLPKAQAYLDAVSLYESGKLSEAEFNRTHPRPTKPVVQVTEKKTAQPSNEAPASLPANRSAAAQVLPKNKELPATTAKKAPEPKAPETPVTTPAAPPAAQQGPDKPAGTAAATPVNTLATAGTSVAPTPTPPPPAPAKYSANLAAPQVVIVAYPKGHAAFAGIADKVKSYNEKYNASDKLTVETGNFNATQDMVVIGKFSNGQKAKTYAIKQKSPQSPLSKIRGIEFVTFVISPENLPVLLKNGNLEEYLTFYKNTY